METQPVTAAWVKSPARAVVKNAFKKIRVKVVKNIKRKMGISWHEKLINMKSH